MFFCELLQLLHHLLLESFRAEAGLALEKRPEMGLILEAETVGDLPYRSYQHGYNFGRKVKK